VAGEREFSPARDGGWVEAFDRVEPEAGRPGAKAPPVARLNSRQLEYNAHIKFWSEVGKKKANVE